MITKIPTFKFLKEQNTWIEIANINESEPLLDLNKTKKIDIGSFNVLVPLPLKSIQEKLMNSHIRYTYQTEQLISQENLDILGLCETTKIKGYYKKRNFQ